MLVLSALYLAVLIAPLGLPLFYTLRIVAERRSKISLRSVFYLTTIECVALAAAVAVHRFTSD
jgi:hypothetical protein